MDRNKQKQAQKERTRQKQTEIKRNGHKLTETDTNAQKQKQTEGENKKDLFKKNVEVGLVIDRINKNKKTQKTIYV